MYLVRRETSQWLLSFKFISDFVSPELVEGRIDSRAIVLRAAERSRIRLPTSPFPLPIFPTSEFPLPHSDFPLPFRFRLPYSDFRIPIPTSFIFPLRFLHSDFRTSAFPLPNSDFPIPTSAFPLPNSDFPIPTSAFPLPNSFPSQYPRPKINPPVDHGRLRLSRA